MNQFSFLEACQSVPLKIETSASQSMRPARSLVSGQFDHEKLEFDDVLCMGALVKDLEQKKSNFTAIDKRYRAFD